MRISIQHSSFVFTLLFLSCFITDAFALEKSTHSVINGRVVDLSVLDQHIKDIGLSGINQSIGTITVKELIELGGETEDEPLYSRSFNHYLNPINNTGYGGIFKSALEWSHSQGEFGSMFGGDYSWPAVRLYYLNALTSPDKAIRDNYFAHTFRGVGQLMHLVEDMSVPAHTRNDGHVLYNYEKWVDNTRTENPGVFNGLLSNPVYFSGAMSTYDPLFLDLAAFSNANFLSNDTIFSGFTYPRIEDTELWTDTTNNRDYLRKLAVSSTGVQVDHLAASSWLYFYRLRYFPANNTLLPLGLDDKVYSDYAALLIPRAVGYSAGLVNYFFRGSIDMEKDPDDSTKYVIKNLSNESIEGAFTLYYDDTDDNRHFAASWNLSINAGDESTPVTFTEPTSPEPKEKGKYILVFSGTLGSEAGAVIGKVVTIEKEKEELILYAVGSQYKTYNLKTKEIKSYNGLLVGATGEVVWREDGKEYLINNGYMTGVGWRGNVAITARVNQGIYRLYLDEKFPNGTTKSYTFNLPFGTVPYYKPQISRDGEQITFGAYYGTSPFTYYLFHLDTVGKNFSFEESRTSKYEGGSIYSYNYPYLMGYYGNALNTLYYNGYSKRTSQRLDSCTVISVREGASTYEKLGDTQSNQVDTDVQGCGSPSSSSTVGSSTDISALNYRVLKDGKEIIPYTFSEGSNSSSSGGYQQRTSSVTPYLYIGGTVIGGESLKYNGIAIMNRKKKSLINLNGRKDKAVVGIWVNAWYYTQDSTKMDIGRVNLVYYVSDKEVRNLTAENPDFKNAEFFTFVEE